MADKQINVNLSFKADVDKAKKQVQDLKTNIDEIIKNTKTTSLFSDNIDKDMTKAIQSISQLKGILDSSMNSSGFLDLSKFNENLTKSGRSLSYFKDQLYKTGAEGKAAFLQLSTAILEAEVPLRRSSKLLDEAFASLKKTLGWQLSSSVIHKISGEISTAYSYAQDLNKSLNEIRIVSGQSADQMAVFAKEANKAAKELSSTTLAYTDASLIFYQQGLESQKDIEERTNAVIKMSNVTGEAVADVSSYMTAIWNNFDDGTKSLEEYADIITALGAATASSSEEIAGGLEQFAAVADVVGLSYEYATSALATITATTRQSESTVGTGLRTVFARIQGLQLGETQDDGTDLNKYSKALESVGVNIKDQNGELKDMDTILDEIGSKWNTLDKATQTALAQTVGGVRQYTTLVSLFDNWDFFKDNLAVAESASGTLDEQAEIYAESWEAARKRVQASAQGIYDSLINDEFFIDMLDATASLLENIENITDALGGMPGIISLLGSVGSKVFKNQLAESINNLWFNLNVGTEKYKKEIDKLLDETIQLTKIDKGIDVSDYKDLDNYLTGNIAQSLKKIRDNGSEEQLANAKPLLDNLYGSREAILGLKESANNIWSRADSMANNFGITKDSSFSNYSTNISEKRGEISKTQNNYINSKDFFNNLKNNNIDIETAKKEAEKLKISVDSIEEILTGENGVDFEKLAELEKEYLKDIKKELDKYVDEIYTEYLSLEDELKQRIANGEITEGQAKKILATADKKGKSTEQEIKAVQETVDMDQAAKTLDESLNNNNLTPKVLDLGEEITATVQGITSVTLAFSSLKGTLDILNNEDLSFFDKLTSVSTTLMMTVPNAISGIQSGLSGIKNLSTMLKMAALTNSTFANGFEKLPALIDATKFSIEEETGAIIFNTGSKAGSVLVDKEQIKQSPKVALAKLVEAGAVKTTTAAWWGLVKAQGAVLLSSPLGIIIAITAALAGLAAILDWAIVSTEEAGSALDESIDKLDEQTQKIQEITNNIDTLNSKIDELNSKSIRTASEETELEKLQRQLELEEKLLAIEEKKEAAQRQQVLNDAVTYNEKNGFKIDTNGLYSANFNASGDIKQKLIDLGLGEYSTIGNYTLFSGSEELMYKDPEELRKELLNEDGSNEDEVDKYIIKLTEAQDEFFENTEALTRATETIEAYEEAIANGESVTDEQTQAYKNAEEYVDKAVKVGGEVVSTEQSGYTIANDSDIISEQAEAYDALTAHIMNTAEANEELSDSLKENLTDSQRLAESILRYDRAITSVTESMEDWQNALDSGNIMDVAEATEALRDTYADLLDLEGENLSEEFLQNKDNLNLLQEAANGSEEAYKQLSQLAAQDIAIKAAIDAGVNTDQLQADLMLVNAMVNNSIDPLEIGAFINDSALIEQLNQIIANSKMTAEEATSYLASMGIDAEVETVEVEKGTESKYYDLIPTPEVVQVPDGVAGTGAVKWTYEPIVNTIDSESVETVPVVRITSAKKSSGGNFKFKSSSAASGNKKASSSGGGSTSKKETKSSSTEIERYHVIKNQLEDLADQYNKIGNAAERAFGPDKLEYLDQQIAKQKEIIAATEEYYNQVKNNFSADMGMMSAWGAQFDANGTITNYESLMQQYINEYNAAVEAYNNGGDEEAMEAAEDRYQQFIDDLKQYEETQDLFKDTQQELIDAQNELLDKQLELIDYQVEYATDLQSDQLEYLDYVLGHIEDDAYAAAEALANIGKQIDSHLKNVETYKQGLEDLLALRNGEGTLDKLLNGQISVEDIAGAGYTEAEVDQIRDYIQNIMDETTDAIDLQREAIEKLGETYESFIEDIDNVADHMEALQEIANSYRDIIDIVGKDHLGVTDEIYKNLLQTNANMSIDQIAPAKARKELAEATLAELEAQYAAIDKNTLTNEAKLAWEQQIEDAKAAVDEQTQNFMDSWTNALETIKEVWENNVDLIIESTSERLGGLAGSLTDLADSLEKAKELNDIYVEDYEKIYQLSKLNRDIQNSIDDTDSVRAKQLLAELQDEINQKQADGVKMSEYELENLRRKYELRLAEIGLEEAQNAKSQVRMVRNLSGDWNYVYTADEEGVAAAEQNYEDKLYAMQQANSDYIQSLQDKLVDLQQQMLDEIAALEPGSDYEERVQKVKDHYEAMMEETGAQLELVLGNNKELYEEDWQHYSDMTGYKISADEDYIDSFDEMTISVITGFETLEEYHQNFTETSESLLSELSDAFDQWQSDTEEAFEAAGSSMDDFVGQMESDVDIMESESDRAAGAVQDMASQMQSSLQQAIAAYGNYCNQMINYNNQMIESLNNLIRAMNSANGTNNQTIDIGTGNINTSGVNGNGGGDEINSNSSDDNISNNPQQKTLYSWYLQIKESAFGTAKTVASGAGLYYNESEALSVFNQKVNEIASKNNYTIFGSNKTSDTKWVYLGAKNDSGDMSSINSNKTLPFASGGYTGAWGPEGRLATLHEKELVLNKDDTANFLNAVDIVRKISKTIDLNAIAANNFSNAYSPFINNSTQGVLEQQVHITAEFPNVSDKNEILDAFDNIINLAAQYVNKK